MNQVTALKVFCSHPMLLSFIACFYEPIRPRGVNVMMVDHNILNRKTVMVSFYNEPACELPSNTLGNLAKWQQRCVTVWVPGVSYQRQHLSYTTVNGPERGGEPARLLHTSGYTLPARSPELSISNCNTVDKP